MSVLISKQVAIEALNRESRCGAVIDHCGLETAIDIISELPPAPPEIIYCKDCGHRDDHGCCKYWKALAIGDIPIATDDNDFCSHAERRNDVFVER